MPPAHHESGGAALWSLPGGALGPRRPQSPGVLQPLPGLHCSPRPCRHQAVCSEHSPRAALLGARASLGLCRGCPLGLSLPNSETLTMVSRDVGMRPPREPMQPPQQRPACPSQDRLAVRPDFFLSGLAC